MKLVNLGEIIVNLDLITWADRDENGKVTLHFAVPETVVRDRNPTHFQCNLVLNKGYAVAVWQALESAAQPPEE